MIGADGIALGVTTANWPDAPFNRWGFRHIPELCRTAVIGRGDGPVRELPRDERDLAGFAFTHDGRRRSLDELLRDTYSDGLVIVKDGAIVAERYLDGMRASETHLLMSCSKSLTSVLFGVLAGRGLIAPSDAVTAHLPELSGSAWEGCRLQDVLDMRTGIDWDDDGEYLLFDVSDYRTHDLHGRIPRDTETWIRTIGRGSHGHGEGPFRYCSLATDLLGWVLERAGGAPFPELFARELWSRVGAEQDAQIVLDHSGFASADGGICTTLRDLARFGLLCLEGGTALGQQVVPAAWLARVRGYDEELVAAFRASSEADPGNPHAFYHDQWWIDDGPCGIYSAAGMNGQAIMIHHPANVVIAKFSTFPGALDDELFALHHAGMLALCEQLV